MIKKKIKTVLTKKHEKIGNDEKCENEILHFSDFKS